MKIDISKEEWELLKSSLNESLDHFHEQLKEITISHQYILTRSLFEKLGSEWFDDEQKKKLPKHYTPPY